jgi:hypothetical protein
MATRLFERLSSARAVVLARYENLVAIYEY